MFKILGSDGREYGPIPADSVRQWIAEGRVNGQSMIQAVDSKEWKPLALMPEFFPLVPPLSATASLATVQINPLAIAGFACSIVSITVGLCCCYGVPFNLAGIGLSIAGLVQIRNQPERFQGRGLALAGLLLGILSILLAALLLVLGVALSWSDIQKEMRSL